MYLHNSYESAEFIKSKCRKIKQVKKSDLKILLIGPETQFEHKWK